MIATAAALLADVERVTIPDESFRASRRRRRGSRRRLADVRGVVAATSHYPRSSGVGGNPKRRLPNESSCT